MNLTVGFDVDGVLRDIHRKLCDVYVREMGNDEFCVYPEGWRQYDVSVYFSIGEDI